MKSVYWLRNDLRFHDNVSLFKFSQLSSDGIFIWCPTLSFQRAHRFRKKFILDSVLEFKNKVEQQDGQFLIFQSLASDILPKFISENGIEALFYTKEPTSEEIYEEIKLKKLKAQIFAFDQGSLIRCDDLPMSIEQIPEQFTSFRKQVESDLCIQPMYPTPQLVPKWKTVFPNVTPDFLTTEASDRHEFLEGGESKGLKRVQDYIWDTDCLKVYKETRNGMVEWNDSSKFSPWLSVGAISPRWIYHEIKEYEQAVVENDSTYWLFFELLWRDYFRFIALKWGSRLFSQMNSRSRNQSPKQNQQWKEDEDKLLENWKAGKTGDDFVDANMRELLHTGWMSNRGRQNVASYLAKGMKVDWQKGASYFESQLIDYDASSNWGNWSYLAGTGQDSRNRSFNTSRQTDMYDPDGRYRDKWLK
jgi:deoxyribodipyrimidine photo-lyase